MRSTYSYLCTYIPINTTNMNTMERAAVPHKRVDVADVLRGLAVIDRKSVV